MGRQRLVWLIPIADEFVWGVQVKLKSLENTCHIYLSASEVVFHEEALYQVYVHVPLPFLPLHYETETADLMLQPSFLTLFQNKRQGTNVQGGTKKRAVSLRPRLHTHHTKQTNAMV